MRAAARLPGARAGGGAGATSRAEAEAAYRALDARMKKLNGYYRPDFNPVVHVQFDPSKGDRAGEKLGYGAYYYPRPVPAFEMFYRYCTDIGFLWSHESANVGRKYHVQITHPRSVLRLYPELVHFAF